MSAGQAPMLAVVSYSFAPRVSGSAILLNNLFLSYNGNVCAIAGYSQSNKLDPFFKPICPTRYLALPRLAPWLYDSLRRSCPAITSRSIELPLRLLLKKNAAKIVLAAYPSDDFVVASFRASRTLGIPFYVHMHDLWIENMRIGSSRARFAEKWEPLILKQSTRVLCMTEGMQRHYEIKYGIRTELLPHTIADEEYRQAPAMRPPRLKRTVLFVGAVSSQINLDALRVLASASELLPDTYELLFCTPKDISWFGRLGIQSSRLRVQFVSRTEVQRLQTEADVLIAPLSHKNCSIDEVRTVFSTKLLEYLVSGRPIVVFAPGDSYQAKSAETNGWGYVVTEDSPSALAAAIVKVATDPNLAGSLVRGAAQEARRRSSKRHAERLRQWVVEDTRNGAREIETHSVRKTARELR